ncbi:DNA polymerase I [Burkholderia phage BcepSauron]|uniref:DNA polymerase I n=1 Tax=Burkholderia phage BcepSauron TaxID=2530033 RepID=A0A482MLT2_9CAUD|nr:DNA polymerase [Burkholderia phage BcepSauron]QBQ74605.1 DNA polymerase I [Burkholderia phage BcepSauron]
MLEREFTFDPAHDLIDKRDPYNLVIHQCNGWAQNKRRIMIVCQFVDSRDLKAGEMLGDRGTRLPFINAMKYGNKIARSYAEDKSIPQASYTVINWAACKHLNLGTAQKREMEVAFGERIKKAIKKFRPTHILFSGDEAIHSVFPQIKHPQYKRGWVHQMQVGEEKIKVVSTLDFFRLLDKQGEHANLLGFWCRHFANLVIGRNPHNIADLTPTPKYIKTLDEFTLLMKKLYKASEVAFDTETRNLSVLFNKILTIQFAMDTNPDRGYVVSVDHPLAHWTKEERLHIKRELKKFFSAKKGPMLLTFNGMFDLRVVRQQLRIPIIWHPVWEITFGEHALDENISSLNKVCSMPDEQLKDSSKFGGLRPILCSYGNDFYFRDDTEFGKGDRGNIANIDPQNPDFLMYAAMDVQSLLRIKQEQLRRADRIMLAGKVWRPHYERHMIHQMGWTAHQLSHLKQDGSKISKSYLRTLLSKEGPLRKELRRAIAEFRVYKEVRQANSELLKESGFKAGFLFGAAKAAGNWMFKLSRTPHKAKLFFDILGLQPLSKTKSGNDAIDKEFVAHYRDKNKIVGLYGEYQALTKLLSTYARGWFKRLTTNMDAAKDNHLRPDYSVWAVVTGRLASMGPNLQQIPSRGKLAKIIKKMFVSTPGYLMIRYDYSAHEVRIWSVASGDDALAEAFRAGQKLRQAYIAATTDEERAEIKAQLKTKGDIHIQNVFRFFKQWVDKDHPLRHAIKAVVFGVLYGKSAKTLGIDTKQSDLGAIKGQISTLYEESLKPETDKKRVAEINRLIEELDLKLTALIEEDRTPYAQDIIDKMFKAFPQGATWTEGMQRMAEEEYYVYSPSGRRRFLPAAMTQDQQIVAQQVRRGSNAPIQGFASEIGVRAGREILEAYYDALPQFREWLGLEGTDWDWRVLFNRTVHDANYYSVPYAMVIPFLHMMQYQATYGVTAAFKRDFNIKFTIEPEIEAEIMGANDTEGSAWDWSLNNLMDSLKAALKSQAAAGLLKGTESEVFEQIVKPWRSKKMRGWLQENYPMLDVRDLDTQIRGALKHADKEAA